jgi:hypothetical protein
MVESIEKEIPEKQSEEVKTKAKSVKGKVNFCINTCDARHELELLKAIIEEEGYL